MAKNPYTRDPGHISAVNAYPGGWLVVYDRREIEELADDRERLRWLVKHIASGKTRSYRTKDEATLRAQKSAKSVMPHDQWWNE
jgi:hypothetical protein